MTRLLKQVNIIFQMKRDKSSSLEARKQPKRNVPCIEMIS